MSDDDDESETVIRLLRFCSGRWCLLSPPLRHSLDPSSIESSSRNLHMNAVARASRLGRDDGRCGEK